MANSTAEQINPYIRILSARLRGDPVVGTESSRVGPLGGISPEGRRLWLKSEKFYYEMWGSEIGWLALWFRCVAQLPAEGLTLGEIRVADPSDFYKQIRDGLDDGPDGAEAGKTVGYLRWLFQEIVGLELNGKPERTLTVN